jgi:ribose transport system ATP-binding protein
MNQTSHIAIRFEHITMRFPGTIALNDVSIEIAAGSCHALCGENGAGKSTLAKILAGIHAPDQGGLFVNGEEVRFSGPRAAQSAGIGIVHQELAFCENLSIAENLCLAVLPERRGFVDRDTLVERAGAMLAQIGASFDPHLPVGQLTIGQQQLVQIAAAVGGGARIIIFDEPTSSLNQPEAERLYQLIAQLKQRGVTCIYVSHRMAEIFRLCDTVSVLRDGQHVATRPTSELSETELVRLMIGRPLSQYFPQHLNAAVGDELLRVERLSCPGKFEDISFSLRAGEIVGLAGLVGAGRTEIACALFGLEHNVSGTVHVRGHALHIRNPREAIALGIGLVPEDRKRHGLVLSASALHNTSLPILRRLSRLSWIQTNAERRLASGFFERLKLRTPSIDTRVAALSGGTQQKVVLARWLAAESRVLLLDEPTRGVDVGAKAEIHGLIDRLATQGHAVLLISSDLPETLALSRRILVLRRGRLVGEVGHGEASEEVVMRLMAGASSASDRDRSYERAEG